MNHLKQPIKYFLIGSSFFLFINNSFGQNKPNLDSLEHIMKTAKEDTTKMNALYALQEIAIFSDIQKARTYITEFAKLASKSSNTKRLADAFLMKSRFHYRTGNIDSMRFFAQLTLDTLTDFKGKELNSLEASAYSRLGIAAYNSGYYEQALEYHKESEERTTSESKLAGIQLNIGVVLSDLGDYEGALERFSQFREIALRLGNKSWEAIALGNISGIYDELNEFEKAIEYAQKTLQIHEEIGNDNGILNMLNNMGGTYQRFDSEKAEETYLLLFEKSKALNNEFYTIAGLIGLIRSNVYLNKPEKALKYAQESYELVKNYPDGERLKNEVLYLLGQVYNDKKEYTTAQKYSRAAIDGFEISGEKSGINYLQALGVLYESAYFSGDVHEAWAIRSLTDSLRQIRNEKNQKEEIAAAEVKFRLREKELEYEAIQKEQELQITKAEGRQNLFLSLFGGALLALFLGFIFYRRIQKAKKETEVQKELVEQSLVEKEVLLKEIHHRVKNNLQIISSLLDEQARKASDNQVKKLMKEGQDRVQSMALIHQNLYESDNLSGIDIKDYLVELTKNISQSQVGQKEVEIELNVDDSKLDIDTAIPIGLILNELITNSFKYAFKGKDLGKISIAFNKTSAKDFLVKVTDNGIGLPDDFDIRKAKSLGLNLVRGLVRQLEGTMDFAGTNEGTNFEMRFSTNA